jgi:hypothetical protein
VSSGPPKLIARNFRKTEANSRKRSKLIGVVFRAGLLFPRSRAAMLTTADVLDEVLWELGRA